MEIFWRLVILRQKMVVIVIGKKVMLMQMIVVKVVGQKAMLMQNRYVHHCHVQNLLKLRILM